MSNQSINKILTDNNQKSQYLSDNVDAKTYYLELVANSYQTSVNPSENTLQKAYEDTQHKCGYWSVLGQCEHGHTFAKKIGCGREWCPECREAFEKRRFGRWLPKAQQIDTMGYLVITIPPHKRPRTAKRLKEVSKSIIRGMKYLGFERGLFRWHWFGDKSHKWHPHMNILLEAGYLSPERIQAIKDMACRALDVNDCVINYRYSNEIGYKIHWLKYIVRATFLEEGWDDKMANELYGFRNTRSWGKWNDEPVWSLREGDGEDAIITELEKGKCPCCHTNIKWHGGREGLIMTKAIPGYGGVELGGGYYILPNDSVSFNNDA